MEEPLRSYGVPFRSYDYVDEYDSMTTAERIDAALASLQRAADNRKTSELAFLADVQDLQNADSPEERDLLVEGSRSLSPAELEIKALKERDENGMLDVNAILEGNEFNPSDARREQARMELEKFINPMDPVEEMGMNNEEAERQARIQGVKDSNAALIAKRNAGKDPNRSDRLLQQAVNEGRITFSGKTLDDVLAELDRPTTNISDEEMADRIAAKKADPRNKFEQFRQNWFD